MPNIALRQARVKALGPRGSAGDGRGAKLGGSGFRVPTSGARTLARPHAASRRSRG